MSRRGLEFVFANSREDVVHGSESARPSLEYNTCDLLVLGRICTTNEVFLWICSLAVEIGKDGLSILCISKL